ncbi:DEAD/DEAH box helicase, putative, partial [Hepatocystis sp. ex Piliocolobus tephrosceles]
MNANWISNLENVLKKKRIYKKDDINPIKKEKKTQIVEKCFIKKDYSLYRYNIEKEIIHNYKKENIDKLYDWQGECLDELKKVKWDLGENFLFIAPTSGGKTLVTEIFAFEEIKKNSSKVFFLFPLNALISEKMTYFQNICNDTNIKISSEFQENGIILCTYEKMNNYFNKNLDHHPISIESKSNKRNVITYSNEYLEKNYNNNTNFSDKTSFVLIIDEFHLINEKGRGIYIENIISKILYLNKNGWKIKLICMSGTLNNLPVLKKWLNARIYISSYRPKEIKEHYICNNKVYKKEKESGFSYFCDLYDLDKYKNSNNVNIDSLFLENVYSNSLYSTLGNGIINNVKRDSNDMLYSSLNKNDTFNKIYSHSESIKNIISNFLKYRNCLLDNNLMHPLLYLAYNSLIKNLSTLIFCSTKRNCEIYINLINQFLSSINFENSNEEVKIRRQILNEKILKIDKYIYEKMNKLITNGICYYYSDINKSIKSLLILSYKERSLFLLTCTSTLSVGLNLQVDRVIITSPFIAENMLTITQYKQMIGRAARLKEGDSFLLIE